MKLLMMQVGTMFEITTGSETLFPSDGVYPKYLRKNIPLLNGKIHRRNPMEYKKFGMTTVPATPLMASPFLLNLLHGP